MMVSAARMAALQRGTAPHFGAGGGVNHARSPVASFTACRPPGFGVSVSDTAKYALSRSTADPNSSPPSALPFPARYCHSTAPFLSGSNAHPTPDFWPATMTSLPLASVVRIGALPKSWSGPSSSAGGQFAPDVVGAVPASVTLQPTTNTSFGVTWDVHATTPVSSAN